MYLVGLTGGIATGKSTVAQMFIDLGCPIIDADKVAREVVEPGKPALRKIRQIFGQEFILDDGTLNRDKLGQVIFSDPEKRRLLNSITHPEIYKAMLWKIFILFLKGHPFVILDLPLLFESGAMVKYLHKIIVVTCNSETQRRRLMERSCLAEPEADQRISCQLSMEEKCSRASFVIDNEGDLEQTRQRVETIHCQLKSSRAHWVVRTVVLALGAVIVYGANRVTHFMGLS